MRGSNEKPSKRALSRGENEIEGYFAELKSEELDSDDAHELIQGKVALSDIEEIRWLMAYVAHLRERVAEIQKPQISLSVTCPILVERLLASQVRSDWLWFSVLLPDVCRDIGRLGAAKRNKYRSTSRRK